MSAKTHAAHGVEPHQVRCEGRSSVRRIAILLVQRVPRLVEGPEEELAERTVGFRIEDEDLEELKTVRDAVDYVMSRLS